jgi:APA family basic amino acid/polyamine antiporter
MTLESTSPFLRSSSGLVRTARPVDVFIYNLGLISIGIALSLTQSLGAPFYPGASRAWACIVGAALMGVIAIGFWIWSLAIPRSGGIYAFLSRGASPGLGFALSFVDSFTWLFYNSLAATLVSKVGLGPLFFSLHRATGSTTFLRCATGMASTHVQFIVGVLALAITTLILVRGMRSFFFFQLVLFCVALVGTLATATALAFIKPDAFATAWTSVAGDLALPSYAEVCRSDATPAFSTAATLRLAMWPFLSFVGCVFSISIGGEVQNIRRSQAVGMFGSLVFAAVLLTILLALSDRAFGVTFVSQVWVNDATRGHSVGFYLPTLVAIGSSPWVGALASVSFIAWAFFWIPATCVYSGRTVLAWSLDRLAPASLGYVHERFHTPVTAVCVVALANCLMLALFLYTSFFGTLVLVLAAMFAWLLTLGAGVVLPWSRKSLFQRTDAARLTLGGVPAMTVFCTLSLLCTSAIIGLLWTDPIAAGHDWKSLVTIALLFGIGISWYLLSFRRRKRRGINVAAAFSEIPIE